MYMFFDTFSFGQRNLFSLSELQFGSSGRVTHMDAISKKNKRYPAAPDRSYKVCTPWGPHPIGCIRPACKGKIESIDGNGRSLLFISVLVRCARIR